VLFALFEQSADRRAGDAALIRYREARTAWADIVAAANGIYGDVSSSDIVSEHGAWADKLAAIDADIAAVATLVAAAKPSKDGKLADAIAAANAVVAIAPAQGRHAMPPSYTAGADIPLVFSPETAAESAVLWYRTVNQSQRWQSVALTKSAAGWRGTIPAAATTAPYALQYYVVFRNSAGHAMMYPGFSPDFTTMPYFVLARQA